MANASDDSQDITLHTVIAHMQKGFDDLRKEMKQGLTELRKDMNQGFAQVNSKIDNLTDEVRAEANACDEYKVKTHEFTGQNIPERVQKLEEKVETLAAA